MRALPILAFGLLTGCQASGNYFADYIATSELGQVLAPERRAAILKVRDEADDAMCLSYGAKPGSDAYVSCRVQLTTAHQAEDAAEIRRARNATAIRVRENSGFDGNATAGIDSYTGQSCLGRSVPNPYGPPKFVCD